MTKAPRNAPWPPGELEILRRVYPLEGAAGVLVHLPHRSKWGTIKCAVRMGLKAPKTLAGLMPKPGAVDEAMKPKQRHIPAGAWRIDHHVPPVSVFGLGGM